MKLYISPNNPTCRKVQAVLNHIGLEAEEESLSFENGDMQSTQYNSKNPNGKIPTLVDGKMILWESNAILMYLCTVKSPDHLLFNPKLRPLIMQWLFWETAHYTSAIRNLAHEIIIKPRFNLGPSNEDVIANNLTDFNRFADILNKHLEGKTFIVGDDWTLVDYAIGFSEALMPELPVDLSAFPNVENFYRRMAENPHWANTFRAEN